MLRTGLIAAGLLLAAVALGAGGRGGGGDRSHTCGALDRQFVHAAAVDQTALALLAQESQDGSLTAPEALAQTRSAELALRDTAPVDRSLRLARTLLAGMLSEYERAVRVERAGGSPGAHVYRSYSLGNDAHQVLADAAPALDRLGCDVGSLLAA